MLCIEQWNGDCWIDGQEIIAKLQQKEAGGLRCKLFGASVKFNNRQQCICDLALERKRSAEADGGSSNEKINIAECGQNDSLRGGTHTHTHTLHAKRDEARRQTLNRTAEMQRNAGVLLEGAKQDRLTCEKEQ